MFKAIEDNKSHLFGPGDRRWTLWLDSVREGGVWGAGPLQAALCFAYTLVITRDAFLIVQSKKACLHSQD